MLYSILYDIFILSETIFAIDVENGVKVPRRIGFDGIMTFLGGYAGYSNLANVLSNLTDVSKIVYMVFVALLYCDLFRTYSPLRTRTHLTLSVIFTVLTGSSLLYGAFTLSLSGRSAVNFDEILAKRRIYYGYGNPGNPYSRSPYSDGGNASGSFGEDRSDPSQDPFSDFADTNKNSRSDDPFGEFSGGSTQGKTNSDDPFADFGSDNGNSGKNSDNSRDGKPYDGKSDDDTDSLF